MKVAAVDIKKYMRIATQFARVNLNDTKQERFILCTSQCHSGDLTDGNGPCMEASNLSYSQCTCNFSHDFLSSGIKLSEQSSLLPLILTLDVTNNMTLYLL